MNFYPFVPTDEEKTRRFVFGIDSNPNDETVKRFLNREVTSRRFVNHYKQPESTVLFGHVVATLTNKGIKPTSASQWNLDHLLAFRVVPIRDLDPWRVIPGYMMKGRTSWVYDKMIKCLGEATENDLGWEVGHSKPPLPLANKLLDYERELGLNIDDTALTIDARPMFSFVDNPFLSVFTALRDLRSRMLAEEKEGEGEKSKLSRQGDENKDEQGSEELLHRLMEVMLTLFSMSTQASQYDDWLRSSQKRSHLFVRTGVNPADVQPPKQPDPEKKRRRGRPKKVQPGETSAIEEEDDDTTDESETDTSEDGEGESVFPIVRQHVQCVAKDDGYLYLSRVGKLSRSNRFSELPVVRYEAKTRSAITTYETDKGEKTWTSKSAEDHVVTAQQFAEMLAAIQTNLQWRRKHPYVSKAPPEEDLTLDERKKRKIIEKEMAKAAKVSEVNAQKQQKRDTFIRAKSLKDETLKRSRDEKEQRRIVKVKERVQGSDLSRSAAINRKREIGELVGDEQDDGLARGDAPSESLKKHLHVDKTEHDRPSPSSIGEEPAGPADQGDPSGAHDYNQSSLESNWTDSQSPNHDISLENPPQPQDAYHTSWLDYSQSEPSQALPDQELPLANPPGPPQHHDSWLDAQSNPSLGSGASQENGPQADSGGGKGGMETEDEPDHPETLEIENDKTAATPEPEKGEALEDEGENKVKWTGQETFSIRIAHTSLSIARLYAPMAYLAAVENKPALTKKDPMVYFQRTREWDLLKDDERVKAGKAIWELLAYLKSGDAVIERVKFYQDRPFAEAQGPAADASKEDDPDPSKLEPLTMELKYPSTTWGDVAFPARGLRNIGSTCYMSAVLQCLNASIPFILSVVENQWPEPVMKRMAKFGDRIQLLRAYILFARSMRETTVRDSKSKFTSHGPAYYHGAIEDVSGDNPYGPLDVQHDAGEFLGWLLDRLHEGFCRLAEKAQVTAWQWKRDNGQDVQIPVGNTSPISHWFSFYTTFYWRCRKCGKDTKVDGVKNVEHKTLIVPFKRGDIECSRLDECLAMCAEEITTKFERPTVWDCAPCKLAESAGIAARGPSSDESIEDPRQVWALTDLPPLIAICLTSTAHGKPQNEVDFPKDDLDLSPYAQQTLNSRLVDYRYKLYGVAYHHGDDFRFGHWTACVANGGEWKRCDDSVVTTVTGNQVPPAKDACVLFYERYLKPRPAGSAEGMSTE